MNPLDPIPGPPKSFDAGAAAAVATAEGEAEIARRLHRELVDGYDEELEMEVDDRFLVDASGTGLELTEETAGEKERRRQYFRELFRLQGELVKLQDWVQHTGHKLVVLFEGRDAAGKGGVIKRITQRLNPRVCKVAGATGAERPRAHAVVLSALRVATAGRRRDRAVRPQLVQTARASSA